MLSNYPIYQFKNNQPIFQLNYLVG